ncbi:unnamed protein product [Rotaria sp. Silwood2]|nr:unnamed protein product [Rotaria sp. Silwood2]CAF4610074.1 unnamed protein product [Rotaria sp. Silwood2]
MSQCLRFERFFLNDDFLIVPSTNGNDTFTEGKWDYKIDFLKAYEYEDEETWEDEHWLLVHRIEEAAKGILLEGASLCNAQSNLNMDQVYETAGLLISITNATDCTEILKFCLHLYTRDGFLSKLINKILRGGDISKATTLGPFCSILNSSFRLLNTYKYDGIVYRGLLLDEEQLKRYQQAIGTHQQWNSFISTSKNRVVASVYGNTLFIITFYNSPYTYGLDISSFSQFPDEEEVLIQPGRTFCIQEIIFNNADDKYNVYIRVCF